MTGMGGILASLNIVDAIALCFILLNALWGLHRGLSGELAHAAGVVVAFIVAMTAYDPVGQWLADQSRLGPRGAVATAFLATAIVAFVAMIFLRILLKRILQIAIAERYDKAAGFVAGTVRSAIIVVIVFVVMNLWPNAYLNRTFGDESVVGSSIMRHMARLAVYLEDEVQEQD